MKKILLSTLLLIIGLTTYAAVWQSQGEAEITFEKTTHNFGSFHESSPKWYEVMQHIQEKWLTKKK